MMSMCAEAPRLDSHGPLRGLDHAIRQLDNSASGLATIRPEATAQHCAVSTDQSDGSHDQPRFSTNGRLAGSEALAPDLLRGGE
jgi:uncharacterized protein involved in copper resistance